MVFESFINAGKHPAFSRLALLGFAAPFAAGISSYYLFKPWAGISLLFLTVILIIPAMYKIIDEEEKITEHIDTENEFIEEYGHLMVALVGLFIGLTAAYFIMNLVLPTDLRTLFFSIQQNDMHALNGQLVGGEALSQILKNNFSVLGISIVLSFFYGLGSILVVVWNSALVASAMSSFFIEYAATGSTAGGLFFSITRYLVHGIPEISGYMIAGLAGSILSIAVMKHQFRTKAWHDVLSASMQLFAISAVIIVIAAIIEVQLTPWLH